MYYRALALAASFLALALPVSRADETYIIKITRDKKAGDKMLITKTGASTGTTVTTDEDGGVNKDEKKFVENCSSVAEETIIAIKDGAKHADKILLKFEKVTGNQNGDSVDYGLSGKTVVAERKGADYECRFEDGGELPEEALTILKSDYLKDADHALNDEFILPGKPVHLGETWDCNLEAIAKYMNKGLPSVEIDLARAKATGKLLKVSKINGQTFGEFELVIDLPFQKEVKWNDAKFIYKEGSRFKMNFTYTGCLDGCRTEGRMAGTTEIKMKGTMSADGGEERLDCGVTMKSEETRMELPGK